MTAVSAFDAMTAALETADYCTASYEVFAEKVIVELAGHGYRVQPDSGPDAGLADLAVVDMVAWLLERRAEFRRQASNAPRDSVEQEAARGTADALAEVAHAITERWVKP